MNLSGACKNGPVNRFAIVSPFALTDVIGSVPEFKAGLLGPNESIPDGQVYTGFVISSVDRFRGVLYFLRRALFLSKISRPSIHYG